MSVTAIAGVRLRPLERRHDERGFFEEIVRLSEPGGPPVAQVSWGRRDAGVVTAWHVHPNQWDRWFVLRGRIRAALHDLRDGSPTRGLTADVELDGDAPAVLTIPNGVAHGYKVLRGPMELLYLTSHEYNAARPAPPDGEEGRIAADDPSIGYDWSR